MSEFVDYLHEVFETFGAIRSRKMFGVQGIYHNDLMFGIVSDDELFLKADKVSIELFAKRDLRAFVYVAKNQSTPMEYYLAPEEIYDDPDEAKYWAELGFQAALRANAVKAKRPIKKKTKKKPAK